VHHGTFSAAPDFGYRAALRLAANVRPALPSAPVETGLPRDRTPPDLSSLRVALNAAEPVRASTIEAFETAFGLESVMIAGYGLAEATVGVSAWQAGRAPLVDKKGSVSVGQPFPKVDIAILGDDGLVEPGELGEILVRSPANTRGYWSGGSGDRILLGAEIQDSEEVGHGSPSPSAMPLAARSDTADLFWKDGFLRTGDLGYLDAAGNLFVAGRLKQIIIQAGRNIAPREVEEIVDTLPYVRRSAAVGIDRGDDAGEQLYVLAEMREGSKPEDAPFRDRVVAIVDAIHRDLGLRPGRVYLTAPRTIPYTANGKVRYGELKASYRSGRLKDEGKLWYPAW